MASMSGISDKVKSLKEQIVLAETDLARVRRSLEQAEHVAGLQPAWGDDRSIAGEETKESVMWPDEAPREGREARWPMPLDDYKRYGRQMIMPEIGLEGQLKLRNASVLVVGVGGLGCPAAVYLAGAGAGTIGLVDGDTVETSNLHRQILHRTRNVGISKVDSAIAYLSELNPTIKYVPYREHLSPQNALAIFSEYDVILDCTDHPTSRYLISDTCVLLCKPLVSASALRTEGQLMVLNDPPRPASDASGGPCYRCVFPKPPPAESVTSCGEGGILGPVVGVMGVLQALEAIKVICARSIDATRQQSANAENVTPPPDTSKPSSPSLLLFSAYSSPPFRTVRLRSRRKDCAACSAVASISKDSLLSGSFDYIQFCGVTNPLQILAQDERISPLAYERVRTQQQQHTDPKKHILIDVREKPQFDICSLPGSVNVPFSSLHPRSFPSPTKERISDKDKPEGDALQCLQTLPDETPIYVVCRLGNDSQVIVRRLKDAGWDSHGKRAIEDIRGGYKAWKEEVDHDWPEY